MHIKFTKYSDWCKGDYLPKLQHCIEFVEIAFNKRAASIYDALEPYRNDGKGVSFALNQSVLKQAIIDCIDDLNRITDYHIQTKFPNCVKEMAYLTYWIARRKPIVITEDSLLNDECFAEDIAWFRLMHINEYFCTLLVKGAMFPGTKRGITEDNLFNKGIEQMEIFEKFLLYYFVYRLDSPKELEAIMLGTTMIPSYEVPDHVWKCV